MSINTEFATNLGRECAAQINGSTDADNWSPLDDGSDIPDGDHCAMRDHYKYCELTYVEIRDIERAYCAGFNSVFVPINNSWKRN